jgi:alanine racemase
VDLSRLESNLRRFRARVPGSKLLFVVKANAYGHGAVACARRAQKTGLADWLGVSSVEEGVCLREEGIRLPILVLGSLYPFESFLAGVEHGLTPTVASLESALRLAEVARRLGRRVDCHLKLDTGMGRIGMSAEAAVHAVRRLAAERLVRVQGVYTHLSCAGSDRAFTLEQLRRFRRALAALARAGLRPGLRHAANSAGALGYPSSRYDMVRPGLALYGLTPGFEPCLTLKSKVVFLKTVPKGTPISYDARFRTRRPSRIASVPIGYADGLPRALFPGGGALLGGRRCPIVGNITMDMMMLDATDVPHARVGDDVVLIGGQGSARQTAADLAERLGTIPYEVVASISSRVPRVYLS